MCVFPNVACRERSHIPGKREKVEKSSSSKRCPETVTTGGFLATWYLVQCLEDMRVVHRRVEKSTFKNFLVGGFNPSEKY